LVNQNRDTFCSDLHKDLGGDYILANPPINMSDWIGDRLQEDRRWMYGTPAVTSANYAWFQHIISH
jgi:type I restriction enzyme M protein